MGKSAARTTWSEEGSSTWSSASTVGATVVLFTGCPGVTYEPKMDSYVNIFLLSLNVYYVRRVFKGWGKNEKRMRKANST